MIALVVFGLFVIYGAYRWVRSGVRLPRFAHGLAFLGLAAGAWMAYLDWTVGEFQLSRALWEVLVMPVLAYAGFFVYSGRLLSPRSGGKAD